MPPLTKQNKSKEADFGVKFRKWWNTTKLLGSFELKYVRTGNSFPFSELHDEQIAIGLQTIDKGCLVRVSSGTIGAADYYGLQSFPVYIVIKYARHFYIISLETLLLEKQRSKKKSLSEDRAEAIAIITV